jgi:hypothetical protein
MAMISVGELDTELLAFPIYIVASSLAVVAAIKIGEKRQLNTVRIKHKNNG